MHIDEKRNNEANHRKSDKIKKLYFDKKNLDMLIAAGILSKKQILSRSCLFRAQPVIVETAIQVQTTQSNGRHNIITQKEFEPLRDLREI